MPIENRGDVTWIALGTGDVAMCGARDDSGRFYVAMQHHTPGAQGHEIDVERPFPIQNGWVAGSGGPCAVIESTNAEGLKQLLLTLMDHGDRKFPDKMAEIEDALVDRERPDGEDGEGWKTATFQLDPDDDLATLSDGAKALARSSEALRGMKVNP